MDKNLLQNEKAPMMALIEKKNIMKTKTKRTAALLLMLLMLAPAAARAQQQTTKPLPYSYGFEDYGELNCWEVIATSSNTGIATVGDAPEGSKVFRFSSTERNAYLASPVFSGTELGLDVIFQYMNYNTTSIYTEQFQIGYTTDANAAPADFIYGDTIYGENRWVTYGNTFPPNTKRIAIKHIYTGGYFLRLDDFNFEPAPSCARPINLTAGTPEPHSVELSWTETGEATAWQICLNGDEENLIDADTNPYTLTGLTPGTEYTVKVRANCGAEQSAWSNGLTFTTPCEAFALPYSYGFEDAGDLVCWEVIATSFNTGIFTANDAPEGSKVFRFWGAERNAYLASPVFSGTELGLDVAFQYMNNSTGTSDIEQFQVGYTTDAGAAPADFIYGDTIYGENHWVTYANTFPENTKRIAIRYIYTNGWSLRLDDFNFGSASCPRPTNLTADPGLHSVELSWTEIGEATAWQICLNDDEENLIDADTNPYTLTGLTPETEYTVKVRANCGAEQSAWSIGLTFTTPCEAFALPYSYGFEDAGDLGCWEVIATSPYTGIGTAYDAPEGSKVFLFNYTEQNAYLASPVFSGTELGLDVIFQYMNYNTTSIYTEQFQIGYTTDANAAPADFTYGDTIYGENHWVTYANAFPANTKRIAIKYIYTYGMYLRLDDFNFEAVSSSCPRPFNLTAGTPEPHSVELSWTEIGEATAWQICVNDDEENLIDADTNPYTLTGLNPATEYTVKVRANCGAEQSAWSNGLTFTTPCEAVVDLPYSYGFEDAGELNCWEVIATSLYTGIITPDDAPEGSKVFSFHYSEQNDYLASPVFSGTEQGLDMTFQYMMFANTDQFQVGYTTDESAAPADFTYGDTIHGENQWVTYENTFPPNTKRIAIKYINNSSGNLFFYLDDFNFEAVSSCSRPADLTTGTLGPHSVELSWTETGEATAWQICVNDDEENLVDADTNPYTLTGLNPVTEYTVKVRANCGSEQSAWSTGLTFTTRCEAFALPYSYGFEDAGDLDCWEVIATYPNTGIATADDAPEGSKVFRFHYIEQNAYLASPVFSGTEQGLVVTFQYMNSSTTTSYTEQFQVGYTTDVDTAPADFTYGETIYGENHWVRYENTFPSNTKRIAIKYIYTNGYYLRLDDFNFEAVSSCPRPADLAVESITATTADLSWNGSSDTESFTVRYRTAAHGGFSEDFESETSFSNWTFISMNTANAIGTSDGAGRLANAAHSGSYGFRFSSYNEKTYEETYDQYLVSPELTVTGELSFYFKKPTSSTETLYFGYSTTTNDLEAFTWTVDLAPIESWQLYTQDLPTDVKYVAFHYFGNYKYYVYVDDIVINIPAGEWETVSTTEMNVTLTGLTPNTLYEAQVKGNCGEDGESRWSNTVRFTTADMEPFTKDIIGYGTGAGGYYLIASPVVEAVTPTTENGFLTNEYDLYRFNPSGQGNEWENHKANGFVLTNGKGYLYATQANTNLIFAGTPYNGSGEVALEYDPADSRKCWNLVGNPFPCEAYLDREYYVLSANGTEINPVAIPSTVPVPPCTAVFVKAVDEGDSVVFTRVAP